MTEKKIRPGRITDAQVDAYARATNAGNGGARITIRAGLAAAYVRRELERRTEPELHPINLDPYPGTVGEVADEIARFVIDLDTSGAARGLIREVLDRLERGDDVPPEGPGTGGPEIKGRRVTPECRCQGLSHLTTCPEWVLPI